MTNFHAGGAEEAVASLSVFQMREGCAANSHRNPQEFDTRETVPQLSKEHER